MAQKAIFLDRDGVINKNKDDYVKNIDEFVMLPCAGKAISKLNLNNYLVIVITNQSVINRGLARYEIIHQIHKHMCTLLKQEGAKIDAIYLCPHKPEDMCYCRKPKTALFMKAIKYFNLDIKKCWLIGDSGVDIDAAKNIGCNAIKIATNGSLERAVDLLLAYDNSKTTKFPIMVNLS